MSLLLHILHSSFMALSPDCNYNYLECLGPYSNPGIQHRDVASQRRRREMTAKQAGYDFMRKR